MQRDPLAREVEIEIIDVHSHGPEMVPHHIFRQSKAAGRQGIPSTRPAALLASSRGARGCPEKIWGSEKGGDRSANFILAGPGAAIHASIARKKAARSRPPKTT